MSTSLHGLSPCALNFNFLRFRNPKSHRDLSQVSALLGSFKAGEVWACVIKTVILWFLKISPNPSLMTLDFGPYVASTGEPYLIRTSIDFPPRLAPL